MRIALALGLSLLALTPARGALHAQSSGSAVARARVLAAITVSGDNDLDFGVIAATQTKTVAAKSGGRFSVLGRASTPVLVQFTQLPSALGPNLVLSAWTGLRNTSPGSGGATAFTPVAGSTLAATLSNIGRYYLWLGATLTATNAAPGSYSVPVVVTVVYN
jgi:hypothetical protein